MGSVSPETALALSHRRHRCLIGYVGLFLPLLLPLVAIWRPTEGLPETGTLESVSDYYYSGAVSILTGALFTLSMFLFAYRGYSDSRLDRILGKIGGIAALGVAFFPTESPPGIPSLSWWSDWMRVVHYSSAALLFSVFILFSLCLFRKSSLPKQERPKDKINRDRISLICGLVMIGSVLWAISSLWTHGPIFWPEALALEAFAVSWLVKGEAYVPIQRLARRLKGTTPDPAA